jgi:LysM repeat protein
MRPFPHPDGTRDGMAARPRALLLMTLALAVPARAELPPSQTPSPSSASPRPDTAGELPFRKLRSLLLDRLPGSPLELQGSPRYLALQEPHARGTRLLVGWMLPGLTPSDLPDLRALTDALATAVRAATAPAAGPFDAAVSLHMDAEAPLVVVELSSSRADAGRALEATLLGVISSLGAQPPESGRVRALARAKLRPLTRAVVEIHSPGAPVAVAAAKPVRHVIERGDTLSRIARAHGLDVERLAALNRLDVSRPIMPGDELKLSDKRPPLPKLYVVKQGDSLAKVARRFGVSEKALVEANRLDRRQLSKGQKLVLPR